MNNSLNENVRLNFLEKFNQYPLIVNSPGRINLIGEHIDYNGGLVMPAAVDKNIVVAITPSENKISKVYALDVGEEFVFNSEELQEEALGGWKNYVLGVVLEIQKLKGVFGGFNMIFSGNIPSGGGMSSSAALTNGIGFAINECFNLQISKRDLILISQRTEHYYAGVKCGIMDMYASMFGEKDGVLVLDCKTLETEKLNLNLGAYQLVLINTNVKHNLSESAYNDRRAVCEKISQILNVSYLTEASEKELEAIAHLLEPEEYQMGLYIVQEQQRVIKAAESIKNDDLPRLGSLLYQSHYGLQHQYKVSCEELDFLVDFTKNKDEVLGARMMGGGFGGCTINLIHEKGLTDILKEVNLQYFEKFKKECTIIQIQLEKGTHVVSR